MLKRKRSYKDCLWTCLVGASGTLGRIDAAAERITDVERRMSKLEMYLARGQQGPEALGGESKEQGADLE